MTRVYKVKKSELKLEKLIDDNYFLRDLYGYIDKIGIVLIHLRVMPDETLLDNILSDTESHLKKHGSFRVVFEVYHQAFKPTILELHDKYLKLTDVLAFSKVVAKISEKMLNLVRDEIKKTEEELSKIKGSIHKSERFFLNVVKSEAPYGYAYYDIIKFLDCNEHKKELSRIKRDWINEFQYVLSQDNNFFMNKRFWVSNHGDEIADDVAHYNIYQEMQAVFLRPVFRQVENDISTTLLEDFQGKNDDGEQKDSSYIFSAGYNLFQISRCRVLCGRIVDVIQLVLKSIINLQQPNGEWIVREDGQWRASVTNSAVLALCVLKLANSSEMRNRVIKTAKWVAQKQHDDGYWVDDVHGTGEGEHKESVMTTIWAAELIVRSGIKGRIKIAKKAIAWLVEQQSPVGLWGEMGLRSDYRTSVYILEFISCFRNYPIVKKNFHELSRDFANKAAGLIEERDQQSLRMSVILSYEAVEMFLYSCLEKLDGNASIINQGTGKTIGLNTAKSKLSRVAHHKGISLPRIENKNYYRTFDNIRDRIIHRGARVKYPPVFGKLVPELLI